MSNISTIDEEYIILNIDNNNKIKIDIDNLYYIPDENIINSLKEKINNYLRTYEIVNSDIVIKNVVYEKDFLFCDIIIYVDNNSNSNKKKEIIDLKKLSNVLMHDNILSVVEIKNKG